MICSGLIDLSDVSLFCILQSSCLQSVSIGWDGGVYVQTCGHTLHIDCQKSYMESLRVREGLDYLWPTCISTGIHQIFVVWSLFQTSLASFIPFLLRTTRSSKVFLLTRVNLPAHCVGSLPIAFFHVALGGAQRLVLGTHPLTRAYVCLFGRLKIFRRDYVFFQ